MIAQTNKFPARTQFLAFRRTAKQIVTPHLRLLYNVTLQECDSRLSVIVPKKLSKLATTRNWLKRLTYDALWPQIKDKKLDCVVIYKPIAMKKGQIAKDLITHELLQITDLR